MIGEENRPLKETDTRVGGDLESRETGERQRLPDKLEERTRVGGDLESREADETDADSDNKGGPRDVGRDGT
jgi:hypothetical protein